MAKPKSWEIGLAKVVVRHANPHSGFTPFSGLAAGGRLGPKSMRQSVSQILIRLFHRFEQLKTGFVVDSSKDSVFCSTSTGPGSTYSVLGHCAHTPRLRCFSTTVLQIPAHGLTFVCAVKNWKQGLLRGVLSNLWNREQLKTGFVVDSFTDSVFCSTSSVIGSTDLFS